MDYSDMVESHKRNREANEELVDLTPVKGFYDGCKKIDWELEELCLEMDRNSTFRIATPEESSRYMQSSTARHFHTPTGKEPFYRQHVKIVQEMLGYKTPAVS
jgi:hypothetical protein